VVAAGEGWVPEIFPLVTVVVVEIYCIMAVMVMVIGMIRIQSL